MSDNQIVINDLSKVYDNGFDAIETGFISLLGQTIMRMPSTYCIS